MSSPSDAPFDIAVAGAGIFGLSIAHRAIRKGLRTIVFEAAHVGAGSSGGVLGALMPHMPARWNPKKEFQFQALHSLEGHIRQLEEETGLRCGYTRCGRILPMTTQDKLDHHLELAEESRQRWHPNLTGFTYKVEPAGSRSDWLDASAAPFGIVYETLAARTSPRGYLAALATFVRRHGSLSENTEVATYDQASSTIRLADGATISSRTLVLAGGFSAFDLIEHFTGERIGRGEKGQALLMDGKGLEDRPAIYCDGLYVVPHGDGTIAIGSTSDREFADAAPSLARSAELVERATRFCPQLAGRKVLSNWAGIRPRCHKRDPLVGRLPGSRSLYAATGGYKISFGIAHLVAECLVAEIMQEGAGQKLPQTFAPKHHFGENRLVADGY